MLTGFSSVFACFLLSGGVTWSAGGDELTDLEEDIREQTYITAHSQLFRRYALEILLSKQPRRGLNVIAEYFRKRFNSPRGQLTSRSRRDVYCEAADAFVLFRHLTQGGNNFSMEPETVRWLFDSDERLALFVDTVSPHDDWQRMSGVIETLYAHDPQGRDRFLNLILAMAVVWDQARPPLHPQTGQRQLTYQTDIMERYDFFKNLYERRKAKLAYRSLPLSSLIFVVDVPVPVSELEWVLDNVDGSARRWKDKFFDIDYDEKRLRDGVFQWPYGSYTLDAIREHGGICVEQAYYATVTARAYGIPALLFLGEGRRGPHAWFGYLKDNRSWEMDAGRYERDNYATGHAVHPQHNRPMTDHEVQYVCDRAVRDSRFREATAMGRLAAVLLDLGLLDAASEAADMSARHVRIYDVPWRVEEHVLRVKGEFEKLLDLLQQKKRAFGAYPDFVTQIVSKQATLLRQLDRHREAAHLVDRYQRDLERLERDDLERFLASEKIQKAVEEGNVEQARREFEELLTDHEREGVKAIPIIHAYLQFTKQTGQTAEGARFVRHIVQRMQRRIRSGNPAAETVLLSLLKQAYQNDGNSRMVERVERELQR
ncbi:MAG: hypothetical protein K9N51_05755, partial [Candidatus Pacebacteria bacterium]|nr:hypothetical protein [Candidatus Paceibacterota bacterium]